MILAAVCLAVVLSPARASADTGIGNGLLAYDCGSTICEVNADGTGAKTLPINLFSASRPRWSPDGSRLTFEGRVSVNATSQVYTVNADGMGLEQITNTLSDSTDPSFTSDGNSILFADGNHDELWTTDANTPLTQPNLVLSESESGLEMSGPVESPDGSKIAFAGSDGGIWTVPTAGGMPTELTSGGQEYNPAWSADSSHIYFRQLVGNQWEVDRVPASGGSATQIVASGAIDPAPSPDGNELAYYLIGSGIEVSSADDALPVQVPGLGFGEFDVSWQPTTLYTVTTAGDSLDGGGVCASPCSLRDAITAANNDPGVGAIHFDIGGGGAAESLPLGSDLPAITESVTIDGRSQLGPTSTKLGITVDGSSSDLCDGFDLAPGSDGSTIRGLAIAGFVGPCASYGIDVESNDDAIAGDYVGVEANGTTTGTAQAAGNDDTDDGGAPVAGGILVTGDDNTIGGAAAADQNVVVSSTGPGIVVSGIGSGDPTSNTILGNVVGLLPDGTSAGGNLVGVEVYSATNTTIGGPGAGNGNVVAENGGDGISIEAGEDGYTVQGNVVGLSASGATEGNGGFGIEINGDNAANGSIVGNVVSGNGFAGCSDVTSQESGCSGIAIIGRSEPISITGNLVGTDASGSSAIPNASDGIHLEGSTGGVTVGGTTAADRNVVSGNIGHGIHVLNSASELIEGNYVGTNAAGTAAIGNHIDGIALDSAPDNTVIGNLASGNQNQGISDFVLTDGLEGNGDVIEGNLVGLNAAGTGAVPNGGVGVLLSGVGETNVGDASSGQGNLIAYNGEAGVEVVGASANDSIRANGIHDNGGLGIDLGQGTNNGQGAPQLSAAVPSGNSVRVTGSLTAVAGQMYDLDFYASANCDPSGFGEGAAWLGTTSVMLGNSSTQTFDTQAALTVAVPAGDVITATATDSSGDTSEFSNCATTAATVNNVTGTLTGGLTVPMSGHDDPISTIPLGAFASTQNGATPAPINGLPINGLPINGLPINGLPINGLPINGLPINGLPINGLPINGLPINGLPINGLPLSSLPINGLAVPGGWATLLAGSPLANQPLQSVTLQQVKQSDPAALSNLTLGQLDLSSSTLGQETIDALALGSTPINGLGLPSLAAITAWCQNTPGCDPTSVGANSLFSLGLAGAPINGLPINGLPIKGLNLSGLPINLLPINGLNLSASPINGLPINGLPIKGLPINGLSVANLADILSCATLTADNCGPTETLGQAAENGQIPSTATIGQLLDILLTSSYSNSLTIGDVVGLLIKASDVPWETLPQRVLSVFDSNRPTLQLTATFTIQGQGQGPADVKIALPAGFDFDYKDPNDDATFDGSPLADPTVTGSTLDFALPLITYGPTSHSIVFDVRSGTDVGPTQATEIVSAGGQTSAPSTTAFAVTDPFSYHTAQAAEQNPMTPDTNVEMSALSTTGSVDYYTIPMPTAGTRIEVHLTDLTADYDLALYSPRTTSVRTGAASNIPLQDGTIADQSLDLQGGTNAQLTPTPLQDVPNPGIPVVQVSANRGTDDEDVGMVSPGGGGVVTIAVFGYNGASSPQPYTLRVTTQDTAAITCPARSFPFAGQGTAGTAPAISSLPSNLNTLILVDEKRIGDTYGAAAETSVVSSLNHLAGDANLGVGGAVIPVEGLAGAQADYNAWDGNPCNVTAANAVANDIANEVAAVKAARPSLKFVVFAGGDDQIPFFRMPDLSLIANESGFADQFNPNEYYGALASSDLLTDNPYLDTRPVPAGGRQLFIPDLVGGRLVETPTEITGAVSRFESSGGVLKSSTAFVSGYDFVSDGSALVQSRLASFLGTTSVRTLINNTWSSTQLLSAAFPTGGPAAINDWNGHYDNYRALAANGTDLISTATLTGANALAGGIFFTMGCHAGFQTTDAIVGATAPDALDWAQYFARSGTGFVGNTGFGLGNTDSVAFSEELMADFAGHLNGAVSVGEALEQAKRDYYLSRDAFSSYDEKTLSEAELYGLPMYGVGTAPVALQPAAVAAAAPAASGPDPVGGSSSSKSPSQGGLSQFGTTPAQTATFDVAPSFTGPTTGAHGQYYTNAGQVQAPNYRPLQPYVTLPATRSGATAHGVIVDALTSGDHSGFDPDNVRPTLDLSANELEPQFADEAWPTKVPTLVSLNDANGLAQQLDLTTGQFFDDSSSGQGVERLWTHIGGRVTYSTSLDFTPPTIDQIDAFTNGSSVAFTGRFSDLDQNGNPGTVAFVQVVYDANNAGTWQPLQLVRDPSTGTWSGGAPFTGANVQFFVEACDVAGNCGYSSNKGRYFDAQALPAQQGSITVTPGGSAWHSGPVSVGATSSTGATVTVSIDGGAPMTPPVTIHGDGVHIVDASASDGATTTAVILVDSTPPSLTLPSHVYVGDNLPLSAICTDSGSGISTCSGTQKFGTQTAKPLDATHPLNTAHAGVLKLVLSAKDNAGNTMSFNQSVTVEKATPAVNWTTPAPIIFGTKLSSTQLNATASVPGSFVYTPPAGTLLQPGTQTLSVTFTPSSTADYLAVTKSVTISVLLNQACVTGKQSGPVVVAKGKTFCVSPGGKVTGPITVQAGGALYVNGGTFTGVIGSAGASAITFCNSTITAAIGITGTTGQVLFGGVASTGCAGNKVTGAIAITKNTGGVSFANNRVVGAVLITNNSGGFVYTGNTITGLVNVSGNH